MSPRTNEIVLFQVQKDRQMKHGDAMAKARVVARLLLEGSRVIGWRPTGNRALLASLSIWIAARNGEARALDPRINDILLFGSTAREETNVNNIDMFLFDEGFYSNVLVPKNRTPAKFRRDMCATLDANLRLILEGFFGFDTSMSQIKIPLGNVKVDLHVLPISILTDPDERRKVATRHSDPRFFEKAFSRLLRFDEETQAFVPITIEELACKYADV